LPMLLWGTSWIRSICIKLDRKMGAGQSRSSEVTLCCRIMWGHLGEKHHMILKSASDIFTPNARSAINVLWELSAKAIDEQGCEFTNRVKSHATEEFRGLLDKQGIPFEVFRAQRQPTSSAHNKGETPFFAASIERAARRNWSPAGSFPPELGVRRVAAGLR